MITHRRIFCGECKRERIDPKYFVNSSPLTITGNRRDDLCPICGSGQIELVEYTPEFLGGDIPRSNEFEKYQLIKEEEREEVKEIPIQLGFIQGRVIQ